MGKYCRPEITSYCASGLVEKLGPMQTQYETDATLNIYGGAYESASLGSQHLFVQADVDYGIVSHGEVDHA